MEDRIMPEVLWKSGLDYVEYTFSTQYQGMKWYGRWIQVSGEQKKNARDWQKECKDNTLPMVVFLVLL